MSVTAQALANANLRLAQQIERIDKVKQANSEMGNTLNIVQATAEMVRDTVLALQNVIATHEADINAARLDIAAAQADIVRIKAHLPNLPPVVP